MWISCELTMFRDGEFHRTIVGAEVAPNIGEILTQDGEVLQGRDRQVATYRLLKAYYEQMVEHVPRAAPLAEGAILSLGGVCR